jgi:leucyl-tRNA synthetase
MLQQTVWSGSANFNRLNKKDKVEGVDLLISLDTWVSILGIVIPFIASIIWLSRKLDKIETNTEPIKTINETMIRLDERTIALVGKVSGTVVVTLKNLGTVSVSASDVTREGTRYSLQFQNPVKRMEFIDRIADETGFNEKEKQMFGKNATSVTVNPNRMVLVVPSNDPKLCSDYVSLFLNWLDSEYFTRVEKVIAEYEQIKV